MSNDAFIHKLAYRAKPVTPLPHPMRRTLAWMIATLLYFIGLVAILGIRVDIMDKLNEGAFMAELLLAVGIGFLAASAACYASLPDMNQQGWMRWTPFVPLGFLTILLTYTYATTMDAPMHALVLMCMTDGYDCTWHIALFSLAPGVILFFMMRRAAAIHYYWAGFMGVLAVTSFGYVALRLLEANDNLAHIMVWHYIPMFAMALLGMWLGKKMLRWK